MSHDFFDGHNGPDWQDWMIIGPMSEDIANEEQEIERARRDCLGEDYLENEDPFAEIDDGNFDMDSDIDSENDF